MPRRYHQPILTALLVACAALPCLAQTGDSKAPLALVRSVKVIPTAEGPAVEIIATRPMTPTILVLKDPARLVIDLPQAYAPPQKTVDFRSDQVNRVRINQFQKEPPVTRLVVDLAKPVAYSWDAAGNRLMIRLYRAPDSVADQTPEVPRIAPGAAPTLVPVGRGSGAIVQTESRIAGTSSVSAGAETTILRLARGGEVKVCPGTTVSLTYSQNGRDMMMGMNTGSLEADYSLQGSADSIMTPDFRILFAGPGEFHYAISADSRGNTCVRSLPGNTASAIVSELMGDGAYQVKSSEQVVFHGGQISNHNAVAPPDCGCPVVVQPALRTAEAPVTAPANNSVAMGSSPAGTTSQVAMTDPTTPLPPTDKKDIHVQVDAPFVFRASDPKPAPVVATVQIAGLPLRYVQGPEPLEIMVLPPAPKMVAMKPRHTGFFGKLKSFFRAIF